MYSFLNFIGTVASAGTLVCITLKLVGWIEASWWVALTPLWITLGCRIPAELFFKPSTPEKRAAASFLKDQK